MVGMGVIWTGRISRSEAEVTSRTRFRVLSFPTARILLPSSLLGLMFVGRERVMASDWAVSR